MRCYDEKTSGITYVGFGGTELELNDRNLSLFHACGTPSRCDDVLVQNNPIDEFSIFNRPSNLFNNANIPQIDIRGAWRHKTRNGSDRNRCQGRRILRNDLDSKDQH